VFSQPTDHDGCHLRPAPAEREIVVRVDFDVIERSGARNSRGIHELPQFGGKDYLILLGLDNEQWPAPERQQSGTQISERARPPQ
jgi:hypothetical protein